MAWEEEALQLVAEAEKAVTKEAEIMRLFVAVTEKDLASGEVVPTPDFAAACELAEATALRVLDRTAGSVESVVRKAASFVGTPGAEPLVEALQRHAMSIAGMRKQAAEFAASTRRMASLPVVEEEVGSSETRHGDEDLSAAGVEGCGRSRREPRLRRRNGRYFGPDWST